MTDLPDAEYGLVMPFVVVASKDGPYDDEAYVAGYEAGRLDALLEKWKDPLSDTVIPDMFHADNQPQIDLICMRYGLSVGFAESADGWVAATYEVAGGPDLES